jgi:hypothetical protein
MHVHFLQCLHGVVLDELTTGTTLVFKYIFTLSLHYWNSNLSRLLDLGVKSPPPNTKCKEHNKLSTEV